MNNINKFEDFLDRMQGLLDNARKQGHIIVRVEDLEKTFPELAESEDEKVRKELISFFSDLPDTDTFRGIPPSKVIAWLEKQKEYESIDFEYVWDRTDCGELTAALDKYSEEAIINMCHAWYDKGIELERKSWLEKQGEKHPDPYNGISFEYNGHIWGMCARDNGVDISCDKHLIKHLEKQCEQKFEMKTAEESLGIDSDTYNKIVDECILGEQKPEDKIEPKFKVGEKELTDEELREGLIRGMINEHNRVVKEVLRTEYEKGRADAVAELHKEWSEEDENILGDIIEDVKTLRSSKTLGVIRKKINWLKSLRPQNQWKPSDEHISLLQAIINEPNNAASESCQIVLKDILEQLKKL